MTSLSSQIIRGSFICELKRIEDLKGFSNIIYFGSLFRRQLRQLKREMTTSNLQCLYCFAILYIHLPLRPSYHGSFCVGRVDYGEHSIGKGSIQYHNSRLSVISSKSRDCFEAEETVKNTWTPNYILYKSTHFKDTTDEGSILFGWISVSIDVANGLDMFVINSYVPSVMVQFVPGEIVTTRLGGRCQENFGRQPFPKVNLAPCLFTSESSMTVPVGTAYVGSVMKSFRFTFRTDFPECASIDENTSFEFRFVANRQRTNNHPICDHYPRAFTAPQNKIYVKDITYGGYDPDPPRESDKVSCNTHLNSAKGWVLKYENSVLDSSNTPVFLDGNCYYSSNTSLCFSGRCEYVNLTDSTVLPTNTYKCSPLTRQKDGIEYDPENPPDAGSCEDCRLFRNKTREYGMSCGSAIGKNIWGLRSTHGIAMVWTAMVIIPLSTLLSRYYKETFMKHRYVNVHVWHGVHAAAACTGFAGVLSGWVAALLGRLYFGFGKNGVGYLHWTFGYLSILSFLVAVFGGSIRKFERRGRLLTIFFHFLAGTVTRICWTICLLSSLYIPGSPAAMSDVHVSGFTIEPAVSIIIKWIMVDVAVHVYLMVNLKSTDKKYRMYTVRTYAIAVPIPVVRPDDTSEFPDAGLKKIVLIVHTVVGILCALLLSVLICLTSPEGRFFGPMWYTHKESGKLNMLMKEAYYD